MYCYFYSWELIPKYMSYFSSHTKIVSYLHLHRKHLTNRKFIFRKFIMVTMVTRKQNHGKIILWKLIFVLNVKVVALVELLMSWYIKREHKPH